MTKKDILLPSKDLGLTGDAHEGAHSEGPFPVFYSHIT